jgi:hypothetical protein
VTQPPLPFDPPLDLTPVQLATTDSDEHPLREQVRVALNLPVDAKDESILYAIQHLKEMAACVVK